jgi:DNA-binding response OmpR family regulator
MEERVLVVEHDPDLLDVLCTVLTGLGFEVDGVPGAAEATQRLRRSAPDVMLLDVLLDGEECEELLESLGDDAPPIVLCSATRRAGNDISARYAVPFVEKPFDLDILVEALDDAQRSVRRPSRLARAVPRASALRSA